MRILKIAGSMSAAMAVLAMAVPAEAQDRRGGGRGHGGDHGRGHHRGSGKIDAGDVLLGAALLGVFALVTSGNKDRRSDNEEYEGSDASQYDGVYDSESAAGRCSQAAEDEGHNYADRAYFKSISSTTWTGRSWVVKGRVDLSDGYENSRSAKFRCALRAGSEPQISFEGL